MDHGCTTGVRLFLNRMLSRDKEGMRSIAAKYRNLNTPEERAYIFNFLMNDLPYSPTWESCVKDYIYVMCRECPYGYTELMKSFGFIDGTEHNIHSAWHMDQAFQDEFKQVLRQSFDSPIELNDNLRKRSFFECALSTVQDRVVSEKHITLTPMYDLTWQTVNDKWQLSPYESKLAIWNLVSENLLKVNHWVFKLKGGKPLYAEGEFLSKAVLFGDVPMLKYIQKAYEERSLVASDYPSFADSVSSNLIVHEKALGAGFQTRDSLYEIEQACKRVAMFCLTQALPIPEASFTKSPQMRAGYISAVCDLGWDKALTENPDYAKIPKVPKVRW